MAVVEIPVEWARAVGGARQVVADGATVDECLSRLPARYPDLARLLAGRFEVFVNWENTRLRERWQTPVSPGAWLQATLKASMS